MRSETSTVATEQAVRIRPASDRPPGPRGLEVIGLLRALRRNVLEFLDRVNGGDIIHFRLGVYRVYVLNHPDVVRKALVVQHQKLHKARAYRKMKILLGNGLITSDGTFHRRQRRMMNPAFGYKQVSEYGKTMCETTVRYLTSWQDGTPRDINEDMMHLTLNILGQAIFGTDLEEHIGAITESVTRGSKAFTSWIHLPLSEYLVKIPVPPFLRVGRSIKRLDQIIYDMIAARRRGDAEQDDIITALIRATDEEDGSAAMTDRQIRDEVVTLMLAGHETTANALSWTWYLLATNPDCERRLHEELHEVLGPRAPTVGDLPKLQYTYRVIAESLRLFPPVYGMVRQSVETMRLGGYKIPKGSVVVIPPYSVHRNPDFWDEPGRFDPDRFLPEAVRQRPKFAYFPFGGGTRQCIGEGFFWVEAQLILATIAQRWRLKLAPGQSGKTAPAVTLRPKNGMKMILNARTGTTEKV